MVSSILLLKLQHKAATVCYGLTHRPRCCRGSYAKPQECWPDIEDCLNENCAGYRKVSLSAKARINCAPLIRSFARHGDAAVAGRVAHLASVAAECNRGHDTHALAYACPRIQVMRGPARSARPPRTPDLRVSPNFKITGASVSERAKHLSSLLVRAPPCPYG